MPPIPAVVATLAPPMGPIVAAPPTPSCKGMGVRAPRVGARETPPWAGVDVVGVISIKQKNVANIIVTIIKYIDEIIYTKDKISRSTE